MKVMRFVILTLLVISILYIVIRSLVAINTAQHKAAQAKVDAELVRATEHIIPPDYTLIGDKYSPGRGIDVGPSLSRIYTVDKPRDVVIDELLRSLKAHGYSYKEDDFPNSGYVQYISSKEQYKQNYTSYPPSPSFTIEIPYQESPIRVFVTVTP